MELPNILLLAISMVLVSVASFHGAEGIGVNYGTLGDNLPSPSQVVSLYQSRNIQNMRLFNPDSAILSALQNSGISLVLGTYASDLPSLANSPSFADQWVATNVLPYGSINFKYITAGNELIPGNSASYVLPAIQNLDAALKRAGKGIPVTTAVSTSVLDVSYPPSKGAFGSMDVMGPLVQYLQGNGVPLLVNVYPYFAYSGNSGIQLDYATFTANRVVVQDGNLGYTNLFDAQVDAVYSALESAGGPNVNAVVSESGWPSAGGGQGASLQNAMTYNNNLVAHVENNVGTPKRPGKNIETYIFAMFNEDKKPAGTEQHFGLFNPDMTEVYSVNFNP